MIVGVLVACYWHQGQTAQFKNSLEAVDQAIANCRWIRQWEATFSKDGAWPLLWGWPRF